MTDRRSDGGTTPMFTHRCLTVMAPGALVPAPGLMRGQSPGVAAGRPPTLTPTVTGSPPTPPSSLCGRVSPTDESNLAT